MHGLRFEKKTDPETGWIAEIKTLIEGNNTAAVDAIKKVGNHVDELEARLNRTGVFFRGFAPSGTGALSVGGGDDQEKRAAFTLWMRSGEAKAMSVISDPDGGVTVLPQMAETIYTVARDVDPMRQVARVVPINKADAFEEIQDQAGTFGASWVSETGSRGDTTNAQLAKLRIPAHEIYAQPKATQQVLDDSSYDVEGWITSKIGEQFGIAAGAAYVAGDGNGKPRGFTTYPTAATADASRGWGTFEHILTGTNASLGVGTAACNKLIELTYTLKPVYRQKAAWFMSRFIAGQVRKLTDGSGRFVWTDSLAAGQPPLLMGYPVVEMESLGTGGSGETGIWFGDMAKGYTIVDRIPIRTLRDPFTDKPYVKFYTTLRTGGDASDFHSLKTLKFST